MDHTTALNQLCSKPIVTSFLDQDLYKLTMHQVVVNQFPTAQVKYAFKLRNSDKVKYPLVSLIPAFQKQVDNLCHLFFTEDELSFLSAKSFFKPSYIDYLSNFKLKSSSVTFQELDGELELIISGTWAQVMLFEIFLLEIINETYFQYFMLREGLDENQVLQSGMKALSLKIDQVKDYQQQMDGSCFPFDFIDFGSRRRFSQSWQEQVVKTLKEELPLQFKGTSNMYLAKKFNLPCLGTMGHEYLQAFQQLGPSLIGSQKAAFEAWVKEYRGELGVALTDVEGMHSFFKDFDLYFSKLFDGLRHDSGCPYEWTEQALSHYKKMGIAPTSKKLTYSDGLNFEKAIALHKTYCKTIPQSFGIGTNLTNDLPALQHKPLEIVIKMIECNGGPVAKLSDSPGKEMCRDPQFVSFFKEIVRQKLQK